MPTNFSYTTVIVLSALLFSNPFVIFLLKYRFDNERDEEFFSKLDYYNENVEIPYKNCKPEDKEDNYSVPTPKLYEV